MIPTPTKTYVNPYVALICDDEDEEDDDATARMSNCSNSIDKTPPEQPPVLDVMVEKTRRRAITAPTRHKVLRSLFDKENVEWQKVSTKRLVANMA